MGFCSLSAVVSLCLIVLDQIPFARADQAQGDEFLTTDNTLIFYKNWNFGQPIVFSHGWPLDADMWDQQMLFFGQLGYQVVAHDRRGYGRSEQRWRGNNMTQNADDLNDLIKLSNLTNMILIGFSAGGGEIVRYIGRYGTSKVAKVVLISSVTPRLIQSSSNPSGVPLSALDALRSGIQNQRSQFLQDNALKHYGFNRPGVSTIKGVVDEYWREGMLGSIKAEYEAVVAFSEDDFTEDLKKIDKPTLILHGDDDQIVPLAGSSALTAQLIPGSTLKVYPGYSHGMSQLNADQINQDILAFIKQY